MRQLLQKHFATRWAVVIYLVSVAEAVGLSVYFNARLTDPEMASMEAVAVETESASGKVVAQPDCERCLVVAGSHQHAAVRSDYAGEDGSGRQRQSR